VILHATTHSRLNSCVFFFLFCFLLVGHAAAIQGRVLYNFTGAADGMYPTALIADAAGNLYGATEFTANYQGGTVFKFVRSGSSYTFVVLYTFTDNTDGGGASGPLALDSHGNLYGTTSTGGDNYKGSVFELSPNQNGIWTLTVLHSFTGGADGSFPFGGVVLDKAGNLYGTASEGGELSACSAAGCGVVFQLSAQSLGNWTETVLHNFVETDGALPSSALVLGGNGVLYGTTMVGGTGTGCLGSPANGCGTVFQVAPSLAGWKETTLHSFEVFDGYMPQGVTVYRGRLFGVTSGGGTQNAGTVFELAATTSGVLETVIHSFGAGTDATQPLGTVVFDKNGNMYGAAVHGARSGCNGGCGAIYQLHPNSGNWTETVLHRFTGGVDGGSPYGTPVLTTTGLFGIASVGGAHNYGVVFELTP
jgi:uncharacterized repeat protein (TIGR03803 family)